VILSLILALQTAARAQPTDEPPPAPSGATETSLSGEHLTLPPKRLFLHALVEMNLSKDNAFSPFSIAPDLYYGVNEKLTLGLIHSVLGATGIMGGVGSSLCLSGSSNGCGDVYNGVGLDARYALSQGKFIVAADGGLYINNIDPFQMAVKLGLVTRYRPSPTSKLAIDIVPNLFIGLTERDGGSAMAGVTLVSNKEVATIPVTLLYSVKPNVALAIQSGLVLPLSDTDKTYFVPLSIGANFQINKQLSIDAAFTLIHLVGGSSFAGGFDDRTFTLGAGYAL
jgi:hypothetical protein